MVSDMAPVAAANGDRAIVAWRSVAGSDLAVDPLTPADTLTSLVYDDIADSILYKIYDNGTWSEAYTLYNGTSGNVKGLTASMMSDGTAGVAYTLDCSTENTNPTGGYETVFAVIGSNNSLINDLRLTNNNFIDDNPQLAVVDFGKVEGGEKFILGWHSETTEGISDIKLAAIDNSGCVYDGFIDSINSINENSAVSIGDSFHFVKGENIGIEDLSLMWVDPIQDYDETVDNTVEKDCLKAVKFMRDANGKIYLTAALDVATLDDYMLIDHFDAYTAQDDRVNAVMLASSYTGILIDEGNGFYTVDPVCFMKSASAVYENDINVQNIYVDYNEIRNDFTAPIQFTIANMGITPMYAACKRNRRSDLYHAAAFWQDFC